MPNGSQVILSKATCRACKWLVKVKGVECDACSFWLHLSCAGLNYEQYERLSRGNSDIWYCKECSRKTSMSKTEKCTLITKYDEMNILLFMYMFFYFICSRYLP